MWFPRRYTFGLAVVALVAGTLPAGTAVAAESPETEGVAVAEFTIVGHKFRIPKAYLTQKGDMAGRVLDDYGDAVFMEGLMPDIRPLVTKHEKKYYRGGEPMLEVVRVGIWSREGAKWIGREFSKEELADLRLKIANADRQTREENLKSQGHIGVSGEDTVVYHAKALDEKGLPKDTYTPAHLQAQDRGRLRARPLRALCSRRASGPGRHQETGHDDRQGLRAVVPSAGDGPAERRQGRERRISSPSAKTA